MGKRILYSGIAEAAHARSAAGPSRPAIPRAVIACAVAALILVAGCARTPDPGKTSLHFTAFRQMQQYLLGHKPELESFRLRGPFDVVIRSDRVIRLSATEAFSTDLYLAGHADRAPLVILLHGYDNGKEDHAYQAMHLASWGVHCLVVQLPNRGPWIANGKTLARIVAYIARNPETVDGRMETGKFILAGHSFGGAAVSVALGEGAPALGGILLDPAAISRELPKYLAQIRVPVIVLGADEQISLARNRAYFYQFIRGGVAEVSIRDTTHEDAQFPMEVTPEREELQVTFASALTAAALSLAFAGNFDYAWAAYGEALGNGKFFNPRKK
jgi:pimeloyl-ACP methyl ester carboxylesterase